MTASRRIQYEPLDDIDRALERNAKSEWYDCRDGLGNGDTRAHKVQSFLVPWGEITTVCGRGVIATFPTRTTGDAYQAAPHRGVRVKCRRCEAEITSGRWVYP